MDSLSKFLVKHRIILSMNEIDESCAKDIGKEVWHNGILCGYYLDDGFYNYSAYCSLSRGNYKNAFRVSVMVSYLNMDKPIEVLFEYMDMVCKEYFDTETFKINRSTILNNIKKVRDGLYDVQPVVSKYFWIKPYTNIGLKDKEIDGVVYSGKATVIMNQFNKSKRLETISKVENAIQVLMHDRDMFLTVADISKVSEVPKRTINNIYPMFKSEIDAYNLSVFNTDTYGEFLKDINITKITSVINNFKDCLVLKFTKRNISEKSKLHINTVYNLWNEDDVQESLIEYNNWIRDYGGK